MSEYYHENLKNLASRLPIAASAIEKCPLPQSRRTIVSERGVVCYQYLENTKWKNLCSVYDPNAESNLQISSYDFENTQLIFILGEAGFYHVESLLYKAPADSKIIFISNQPSYLRLIFESRDLTAAIADERLVIVASEDMEYIRSAVRGIVFADTYNIPTFSLIIHPVEENLQSNWIYEFQSLLHWVFTASLTNASTTQFFEHWWVENFISNIPYLLQGTDANELENSWLDKPVIVVGAGPSLNKNIHHLHEAKGKALIMCVDTAYRILSKHGIEPDLVVTLDGSPMNAEHMKGCSYSSIPLLMDVYSHRDIGTNHKGPKIIVTSDSYHESWWTKVSELDVEASKFSTGGSVATAACGFARFIGANPVILIGVDLSYPNGSCYADGALHDDKTIESIKGVRKLHEVISINGEPVSTTDDYLFYLRWLHKMAKQKDRTYINATEGGAVREGFSIKTLQSCLTEECKDDVPVVEWRQSLSIRPILNDVFERVLRNLKRSRNELKLASKLLITIANDFEKYLKYLEHTDDEDVQVILDHLNKANHKMSKLLFAKSFLDAHSFSTIYRDVQLAEAQKKRDSKLSQVERLQESTTRSFELALELAYIAKSSVNMHNEALNRFKENKDWVMSTDDTTKCV